MVIPTYNRAELLRRAIKSVEAQTYSALEVIVVDDASTDETQEVVRSICDPRIRYIRHEVNRGGAAARNTGIRAATGEFIAFLDDDDEWESEKTSRQVAALQRWDVVLCTSSGAGKSISNLLSKDTLDNNDLRRGKFTAGGTGLLMARSHVLKEITFDESLPRYQDWDLFIRIGQKWKIAYLNLPLVRYNDGGHSRISNRSPALPAPQLESELRMLRKHRSFLGERLYRWHMCRSLMYAIWHRSDKWAHIVYVGKRYGMLNVARMLVGRMILRIVERTRVLGG